MEEQMEQS
jgi:hypothetical protein